MRQLFGTDGIRAVAGEYPLDGPTVTAIGRALGARLKRRTESPRVVVGMDTRESSVWIADALASGLAASGAAFESAGVITTPGIAYLTRTHGFNAGVVISASHNPWQDNGIKLFGPNGMKLADAIEHEIEQDIFAHLDELASGAAPVHATEAGNAAHRLADDYIDWLCSSIDATAISGMRVVADCAHGAASAIAPALFEKLGLRADIMNASPDGRNINSGCGALYPQHVADHVRDAAGRYDLGITFDGDADRALFSDANGHVVNGDAVMLVAGRDMKSRGKLPGDTV
ncbi:MAG TPA: phosphoglucosamine mutase, partial [Clostridia bacterium]|nr:phosphoglucosamine mutase [Clostridia bacterium]